MIAFAGANPDASARLGREVLVGADPLPRLMELIETAERQGDGIVAVTVSRVF
jgi:hypothetical protein